MSSNAQESRFNCDPGNYSVLRKYRGETFKVECDTIYLVNKSTFALMFNAYNDFRNQNLLLNQYTMVNDSISNMYEAQLDTQKLYFDSLNASFNRLNTSVDQLVKKSSANIDSIAGNLNSIESQIRTTKENISNAQHEIVEAKKQIRRTKLKWGAIGFGAGIVITFIVSAITLQ
jgi:methyl-accepting chemotaxis protein